MAAKQTRGFIEAHNALTALDWADAIIRQGMPVIRARQRQLAGNLVRIAALPPMNQEMYRELVADTTLVLHMLAEYVDGVC